MSKPDHTVHLKNLGNPRRSPVPSATTPKAKEAHRDRIQAEIDSFLADGGTIKRPDLQNRTKKVIPRFGASLKNSEAI